LNKKVVIRELKKYEINLPLFSNFNRYQEVTKCWRKIEGEWKIKEISFVDNWDENQYKELVKYLLNTVDTGGTVWGVFKEELVGFASLENEFFGSKDQYLQLSSIHISKESRGEGLGKKLFKEVVKKAKSIGLEKIYISANSSIETIAFYKSLGCVEAEEYNKRLVEEEPCDCQLEYVIKKEN